MQPDYAEDDDSVRLSASRRNSAVCKRLEAAWRAGQVPHPEDFLGDAQGVEREALLRELLAVDREWRRQKDLPQYVSLSPDPADTVNEGLGAPVTEFAGGSDAAPVVAGYEVRGQLGEGGMARVYRAHHAALDR